MPATILFTELEYHYGGGGAGTSTRGGVISTALISSGAPNNVWVDISTSEAQSGITTYACVFIKNATASGGIWSAPKVWVDITPETGESLSLNTQATLPAKNSATVTIASNLNSPAGIAFTAANTPSSKAAGIALPNLGPNEYQAIWLKRVINPGAGENLDDHLSIRVEGDTVM